MKKEELEKIVLDVLISSEDSNSKCLHSYSYEEVCKDIAEKVINKLPNTKKKSLKSNLKNKETTPYSEWVKKLKDL